MGSRVRFLLGAVIVAAGCATATQPAKPKPIVPKSRAASSAKPPPKCPAVVALLRTIGDDSFSPVVRVCMRVRFRNGGGWLIVASKGPEDRQSEASTDVFRILVNDKGTLIAKGPSYHYGWMTGAQIGKFEAADLDGDGADEILERVYRGDENDDLELLNVYRHRGNKLVQALSLVTKTEPITNTDPQPHKCALSYKLVRYGKRREIRVTATTQGFKADDEGGLAEGLSPTVLHSLYDKIGRDASWQTIEGTTRACLDGKYVYTLTPKGFQIKPAL